MNTAVSNSAPAGPPSGMLGRLLVVDDEVPHMKALCEMLTKQRYEAVGLASGQEALEALRESEFDLLLTDLMMPGMDGIELLRAGRDIDPHLVGLIMTGQGTVQTAVEAMKTGAFDYVLKPFKLSALLPILSRALDVRRLRMENVQLRETVAITNLSQVIALSLDSKMIVEQTADAAVQQLGADEVSLMLVTPAGDALYVAAVRGDGRDGLLGQHVPFQQGIAGWVARQREPLVLNGEVHDSRFAPVQPRVDIRSAISMPLLTAGKVVGVLNANNLRQQRPFTPGQVKALSILTSTAAAALNSAALFEEAGRLRDYNANIVETMAEGLTLEDAHGRITFANRRLLDLLGYRTDELIGQPWHTIMPRREPTSVAVQSLEGPASQATAYESALVAKSGRTIPVLVSARPFEHGEHGAGVVATFADLTERKRAEAALAQINDMLSRAEQIGHIGSWAWDIGADRVVWSDGLYRMFGVAREGFGTTFAAYLERVHPDDREAVHRAVAAVQRDQRTLAFESRIMLPDGGIRILDSRAEVVLDDAGEPVRLFGISIDITERKQAEAVTAASEAHLRALFAAMTDVVLVLDGQGRYIQIAPTNPVHLVKPRPELLGRTIHDVLPPVDAEKMQQHIRRALQEQQAIQLEYSLHFGGVQTWIDATISPLSDNRVIWIARDITQRIQRERELEAIAAVSTALRTANTQAQMLPIVLEQVMGLLDTGAAALAMRDPTTDELVIELGQGELADLTSQRLPAGAGIVGQALTTRQPYVTDDVAADPHYYQLNSLSRGQAAACVPLMTSQQVLGVLWAERASPFTTVEVRVLSAIAGIAANAVQRAGLHEQTEQRLRRLAALREIDSAIMNSLDLSTTLSILLGHVTSQLGVDASDILLLNRGSQILEYVAGRGFRSKAVEQSRLRLGEGHAGQAALERRLVASPDLRSDPNPFRRAVLLADESFVALFCVPLVAKGRVVGVLEVFHRAPLAPDADWLGFLETLGGQAAIAVADAWLFDDLQRSNTELLSAYDSTLEGWSAALDLRDKETEGHSQRVTELTIRLARRLGVGESELEQMRRGALLHDIGKMGVPDAILNKPGKLTDEEWVIMRQHPQHAYELLSPIAYLRPALAIPYDHHEKWDGTGYPRQLKGNAIPLSARIFAVVDVWDALCSNRPYRAAWPAEKVRAYIRDESGKHFDPAVVAAFLEMDLSGQN